MTTNQMEPDMTYGMKYDFSDKAVTINGKTYFAEGAVYVSYVVHYQTPGVGIFERYAEVDSFGAMDIDLRDEDGGFVAHIFIASGTELHSHVMESIDPEKLQDACVNNFNNGLQWK